MDNYRSNISGRRESNKTSMQRGGSRRSSVARTSRDEGLSRVRTTAGRSASRTTGHHDRRKKRPRLDITQILLIVIGVLVVILCAALIGRGCAKTSGAEASTESTESTAEAGEQITVDGVDISGKTQEEARQAILDQYGWDMKVKYEDKEAPVSNLMEAKVDELLEEIYAGELKPGESYEVNTDNMIEAAKAEAALVAGNWNMVAKNGGISGYDKDTGKFTFTEGTNGLVIDQDKLAEDMVAAIQEKNYSAVIEAEVNEVSPEMTADQLREKYKTIGTYSTTTTSNSNRNENIRLAVEALNGTIVNPGQEFSFNDTTGARTEEKGYKPATAYLNGEVVQEPGGGVCQVSSTLYNAVIFAGLKSTERHAHSYEPSYVTPGEDAAVSYGGPDFKFVNNSDYPIAIKASFDISSKKLTTSIYGVQILEDGVKIRMSSEKTGDIDPPAPVYEEDQTVPLDQEIEVKAATPGTRWTTYLVTYKNDQEVSREFFHNSSYRGKAATIKRNTSGVVITTVDPSAESTAESLPGESVSGLESAPAGPGAEAGPGTETSAGGENQVTEETTAPAVQTPVETPAPQPSNPVVEQGPAGPGAA